MILEGRRLVERAGRWLLRHRRHPFEIAAHVAYFSPAAATVAERLPVLLVGSDRDAMESAARALITAGVPERLAIRVAGLGAMVSTLDLAEVAHTTGQPVEEVAAVYFSLGDRLQLSWLRERIVALPRGDRWQGLARVALRDDLYSTHRALVADVLRIATSEMGAEGRINAWIARNRPQVERYLQVLADIKAGGIFDLATLSAGLRELRNLIGRSDP
jgi:glutamate dehydrogenase